jgi:hypothetical protein
MGVPAPSVRTLAVFHQPIAGADRIPLMNNSVSTRSLALLAGWCIFQWRLGVLATLGVAAAAGIFTLIL